MATPDKKLFTRLGFYLVIKYLPRELWQGLDKVAVEVEVLLEVEVEVEGLLGAWRDWVSHILNRFWKVWWQGIIKTCFPKEISACNLIQKA